jgi:phosphatidylglycerol:prolipoprotein diacylglycerol transferase
MLPTLFEIPLPFTDAALPIHTYGTLIAVGFLLALHFITRDAKKAGLDPEAVNSMAIYGLILGLVGTRVRYIMMFPEQFSWSEPLEWFAIWQGGLVFEGAVPPVVVFVILYMRWKRISPGAAFDVIVPYVPLAHAFGRMGCFAYGCCYGRVTTVPWAVSFPAGSPAHRHQMLRFEDLPADAAQSLPVHPTQLYSVGGLLALFGLLLLLRKTWRPFSGFTLPVWLAGYGLFRFGVEFFRGDNPRVYWNDQLSAQQVFSLALVVLGVAVFFVMRHWTRRTAAEDSPGDAAETHRNA